MKIRMFLRMILIVIAVSLTACAGMPRDVKKAPSYVLEIKGDTRISKYLALEQARHPGYSSYYLIPSDMDAFIARAHIIDLTDRTLDLQYFEVDDGMTTDIIMEKLIAAADRGVRVRLLFDDYGTTLSDAQLWLLDSHENIEVRLFNPLKERTKGFTRSMEAFGNFSKFNHRMHNKAFIADNAIGIVGGRNLADAYFGAREDSNFQDMDLMAAGPIVPDISKEFDTYWNSRWAIPLEFLTSERPDGVQLKKNLEALKEQNKKAKDTKYAIRVKESDFFHMPKEHIRPNESWAKGVVLYDLPEKVSDEKVKDPYVYLLAQLLPLLKDIKSEMILVAPYFVPGESGMKLFKKEMAGGMKIKVLTNSLASTDEPAVYAGYEKYRKPLIEMGVELYELRAMPTKDYEKERKKNIGTSGGELHAKFYVFDRKAAFVGSRNLDNRSNRINTEVGIFVESPEIAGQLGIIFDVTTTPKNCFKLSMTKDSKLVWTGVENGKEVKYYEEPDTTLNQRSAAGFYSVFAPESEL